MNKFTKLLLTLVPEFHLQPVININAMNYLRQFEIKCKKIPGKQFEIIKKLNYRAMI